MKIKESKIITGQYFYCVVNQYGFVYIFNAAYYRKIAINSFMDHVGLHADRTWKEYKKKGYKCLKFKIEEFC